MKKNLKAKSKSVPAVEQPDIAGFMARIEEELRVLAKKIDSLTAQNFTPPVQARETAKPFQRHEQPRRENNHPNHSNHQQNRKERVMYQAVCAQCQNTCEVPFRPTGDRPVYCKECFSSRKTNGLVKPDNDHRPRAAVEAAPGLNNSARPADILPPETSKKVKNKKPAKKSKK